MRYMLDTNIISDLVKNPQGKAAKRIAKVGEDHICTSIVVAAPVLPFDVPVDASTAAFARSWRPLGNQSAVTICWSPRTPARWARRLSPPTSTSSSA